MAVIYFPVLRTRRLTVQLHELSIGDSIKLAGMPPHMEESACTAFLRCTIETAKGLEDPAEWTVQERMLVLCHYLSASLSDGPDFAVGDALYSDYLDATNDIQLSVTSVLAGEVGGDSWSVRHLTGAMAEAIERLAGEVPQFSGYGHWVLGGMAAQLIRAEEQPPDPAAGEGVFDESLLERMRVLAAYPASDFEALMEAYLSAREKLHHLFRVDFSADGLMALPVKGGEAQTLPPARFQVDSSISSLARLMGGKHPESGA